MRAIRQKGKGKSKAQRRQWWDSLSPERQRDCIEYWIAEKGEKRRAKSVKLMQKHKNKYSCEECLHGRGGHCTDILPHGCEYWFNPNSRIIGLAYKNNAVNKNNKAQWAEKITKKNPWLT